MTNASSESRKLNDELAYDVATSMAEKYGEVIDEVLFGEPDLSCFENRVKNVDINGGQVCQFLFHPDTPAENIRPLLEGWGFGRIDIFYLTRKDQYLVITQGIKKTEY